jgi:WD40 repeat protein
VWLWDTASGQQIAMLEGHTDWVRAVAFSPDGRLLASASADRSVWLWDTARGRQIAMLEGHTDWVRGVAFSPDGRLLASAGNDRSVRLWDTTTTLELFQLRLGIQALAVVWGALRLSVPAGTSPVVLKLVDHTSPSR